MKDPVRPSISPKRKAGFLIRSSSGKPGNMTIGQPEGGQPTESVAPPVNEAPPTEITDTVAYTPEVLPVEEPVSPSEYVSPEEYAAVYQQQYVYGEHQPIEQPPDEQAGPGEFAHYSAPDHTESDSALETPLASAPEQMREFGAAQDQEGTYPGYATPGVTTYQEPAAASEQENHGSGGPHQQVPSEHDAPDLTNYYNPDGADHQPPGLASYQAPHGSAYQDQGHIGYDEPTVSVHQDASTHGEHEPVVSEDRDATTEKSNDATHLEYRSLAAPDFHPHAAAPAPETDTTARSNYAAAPAGVDEAPPTEGFAQSPHLYDPARSGEHLAHDFTPGQSSDLPVPPPFYEPASTETVAEPVAASEDEAATAVAPKLIMPTVPGAKPAPVQKSTSIPAAFLPRFAPPDTSYDRRGFPVWAAVMFSIACLGLGALAGYVLPKFANGNGNSGTAGSMSKKTLVGHPSKEAADELTKAEQDQVDTAFAANKAGNFVEAVKLFAALQSKHPEWGGLDIEIGRSQLYAHDLSAAGATLKVAQGKGLAVSDASFLLGLLFMTNNSFPEAEASFAKSTALDPTRPDFYYFWGECLRREGKPLEAIGKFRAALLRNQYETAEGLYRLKLWLSSIQADQEKTDGTNQEIDAGLTQVRPPMEALFAAAVREIKAGRIKEAADRLHRARQLVEPTVFFVIMQDPSFVQESWRPELADLYKSDAPAANPNAGGGAVSAPPSSDAAGTTPPSVKPATSQPKGR